MLGLLAAAARQGRAIGIAIIVAGIFTAGLSSAVPAVQGPADAGAFLADLSKQAMAQLNEPGLAEEEKQRRFRVLLNQGFDVEAIAKFVLGRYWRSAQEPERREFLKVFEDSMIYRFLPILGDYSGEVLKVGIVRPFGNAPDLYNVDTVVNRKEGPPVNVSWRVHKGADGYKVLDVLAEGISVAVTLRSEYGSVLKHNGGSISALSKTLRDKMAGL